MLNLTIPIQFDHFLYDSNERIWLGIEWMHMFFIFTVCIFISYFLALCFFVLPNCPHHIYDFFSHIFSLNIFYWKGDFHTIFFYSLLFLFHFVEFDFAYSFVHHLIVVCCCFCCCCCSYFPFRTKRFNAKHLTFIIHSNGYNIRYTSEFFRFDALETHTIQILFDQNLWLLLLLLLSRFSFLCFNNAKNDFSAIQICVSFSICSPRLGYLCCLFVNSLTTVPYKCLEWI